MVVEADLRQQLQQITLFSLQRGRRCSDVNIEEHDGTKSSDTVYLTLLESFYVHTTALIVAPLLCTACRIGTGRTPTWPDAQCLPGAGRLVVGIRERVR